MCVCSVLSVAQTVSLCLENCMGRKRIPNLETDDGDRDVDRPTESKRPIKKLKSMAKSNLEESPEVASTEPSQPSKCSKEDVAAADFEKYVFEMWLRNENSAPFVQGLSEKASAAGARGVDRIAHIGAHGDLPQNMSRDLKRQIPHKAKTAPRYYAKIPCWNDDKGECEDWEIPFIIPYEFIFKLIGAGALSLVTLCNVIAGSAMATLKSQICDRLQNNAKTHMIIGLHSDGVPMQKSGATIECQSFNFPNSPQMERLLWCVLEKQYFCKCGCSGRHTMDKIYELFVWMCEQFNLGIFPSTRHDKEPWKKSDKWRAQMAGKFMGFTGSVGQLRSDWLGLKQVFSFGGWNANRMCFKCRATQPGGEAPYDDVSPSALWRAMRLSMNALAADLRLKGLDLSPVFSLPGFLLEYIVIDVLHAVDLGCAADAVGSFFYDLVHGKHGFLDGSTALRRVQTLWAMIKTEYKKMKTPNRLQSLTLEMIVKKKKNSKPKLRAKGAEMRRLVPCVVNIAKLFCEYEGSTKANTIWIYFRG